MTAPYNYNESNASLLMTIVQRGGEPVVFTNRPKYEGKGGKPMPLKHDIALFIWPTRYLVVLITIIFSTQRLMKIVSSKEGL